MNDTIAPNSSMRVSCGECSGAGYIYFGDSDEYSVFPCDCII